jgi:uncharacterized membrane protein YeaQ/YmgE (transglycosylase-associated protein family)
MRGVGLLGAVVIGLLAGWIAARVVRSRLSLFASMGLGIVGALVGTGIVGALGLRSNGMLTGLAVATVGAILLAATAVILRRGR